MYHGILIVNKEAGYTSHDVVAKLRGICGQRKIGHTGTLDPDATGVLPVCLGNATGICDMLTEEDKEYEAILKLGVTTDTQDSSGTLLSENVVEATKEEIREAILSFQGEYDQIPPMYSALKVGGKKLYQLAREGKEVERQPRRVEIKKIEILDMNLTEIGIRVVCTKGTYIRTLCHDIGQKLGCGAVMKLLKRTRVGRFTLEDARVLSDIEQLAKADQIEDKLIAVDSIFEHLPKLQVKKQYHKLLINGNKLYLTQFHTQIRLNDKDRVRVYSFDNCFFGIFSYRCKDECFQPVKMFFP